MTGLGLIVSTEFAVDAVLLRLPNSTQGWTSHLVRVKHCTRLDDGRFQVGCAFARPLSVGQLRSLLA